MARGTFTVRGHEVRTQSNRRYVVVAVRPFSRPAAQGGHYVAFARVHKRSDSLDTACREARRYGSPNGAFAVVVDTTTGAEVGPV